MRFVFLIIATLVVVLCSWLSYKEKEQCESFSDELFEIRTSGSISGGSWQAFGFGKGKINNERIYYTKRYFTEDDGSINFITVDDVSVRCQTYTARKIRVNFIKKTKYNQVFLVDPCDRHWILVKR